MHGQMFLLEATHLKETILRQCRPELYQVLATEKAQTAASMWTKAISFPVNDSPSFHYVTVKSI